MTKVEHESDGFTMKLSELRMRNDDDDVGGRGEWIHKKTGIVAIPLKENRFLNLMLKFLNLLKPLRLLRRRRGSSSEDDAPNVRDEDQLRAAVRLRGGQV